MAEHGESSNAKSSIDGDYEVWAKLVPSDSQFTVIEINSNEMAICSLITSKSSEKHEWCKITRNSDLCSATIHNKSINSIIVDDVVVQSGDDMGISCGHEITSGPDKEVYVSFKFEVIPAHELGKKKLEICIDAEHSKCSICLNIWHDVVTVAPCFHNFCNGCLSEWLRISQKKRSSVLCPQCRGVVQYAGRNHFLHNIEEDILQADASLIRSDEEIAQLNSYATIRSNLVLRTGKKHSRKRVHSPVYDSSPVDDESYNTQYSCPQCGSELNGYQCSPSTVHLQCQACGGMMPSRTDPTAPQHCLGCDRTFCGAYWHAQRATSSDTRPICNRDTFKPISERTTPRIPISAHENNRHEQDITERCIRQAGKTVQDVISEWITKFNNREIDRTRLSLNHAEMITAGTHVCNDCYDKLVSFLLYWFRISLPSHYLPAEASNRDDCWYGYACRTQHHNEDHARKRNHVCRSIRGRGGSNS